MRSSKDDHKQIEAVAQESLETFTIISRAAASHIFSPPASGFSLQISNNSWTSPEPDKNIRRIDRESVEGYQQLSQEPAIARVTVVDDCGDKTTYFICRTTPITLPGDRLKLASYRSPVGRLAALPVGADHTLFRGGVSSSVQVLESARFQPKLDAGEWDSLNSIIEGSTYGPLTIESLRKLLHQGEIGLDATVLDQLLSEESEAENIRQGLRRSIITKMDLRDQPVLDQYQDDIFRLPLNSRLLILGAPGTGKTTTLIRRLGQKLDVAFLNEEERRSSRVEMGDHQDNYAQSWIMFTPTELLRLYVKEAFNREGVPAPDDRISTWSDFRENLARNEFAVLRSTANRSSLILKDELHSLKGEAESSAIEWFEDFDGWQKSAYWSELRAAAESLKKHGVLEVSRIGVKLLNAIGSGIPDAPQVFDSLLLMAVECRAMAELRKADTDAKIRGALNLQVNRDRRFLDELGAFIETLSDAAEDAEDQDADEDDDSDAPRVGRAAALTHYMRAVRSLARARARKRNIPKSSRLGRVAEWLGSRVLRDDDLLAAGESLLIQSALRWFINPVRRYIDGIPLRYRQFRRSRQAEGLWYHQEGFNPADVHPLEVDVILLALLRETNELIRRAPRLGHSDSPAKSLLERLNNLYRTQVLVDEATDFSPIQLACMITLARPETRSFFACGDFNQRVTRWGTRSAEQIRWVIPNIETRTISIAYRQSRLLHDLAKQIVSISGDGGIEAGLPDYVDNDGVTPVLALRLKDIRAIATWLAERILEIETFVQVLPSIAVLVNSEAEVRPIADALGDVLAEKNIRVVPCPDGQVRGRESAVRVFNVQHIKGLEFEAVFFVGIDKLAEAQPDLFNKYLYVGATRAATYLGITSEATLPANMGTMRDKFAETWR